MLLDQLRSGLKSSKVLHAIEKNPTLFETLFVHSATRLDATAIKDLLKPKSPLSSDEHRQIWGYLFQFIDECNETGKKDVIFFWDFLYCIFSLFLKKVKVKSAYEHSGPSGWSLSLFL